jgi:hypothetical protein
LKHYEGKSQQFVIFLTAALRGGRVPFPLDFFFSMEAVATQPLTREAPTKGQVR